MSVTIDGIGSFTPNQANHLGTGGEASVYKKDNLAVKILKEPDKARANNLPDKIDLLSHILSPRIAVPRHKVYDNNGLFVGYAMPLVSGEPVFKIISGDWKKRTGFQHSDAIKVVEEIRLGNVEAHKFGAVIGDGNEMNYIYVPGNKVVLIDTDSWKIGKFPVTAVQDLIRDPRSNDFTEESDWFSMAVVTFQVLTGVHPYKGNLPGYSPQDTLKRMKDRASVFHPNIKLNARVGDFNKIPSALLQWYKEVFDNDLRTPAPSVTETAAAKFAVKAPTAQEVTSGKVKLVLLGSFPEDVAEVLPIGIILTRNEAFDLHKSHFPSLGARVSGYVRDSTSVLSNGLNMEYLTGVSLEVSDSGYFEHIKYPTSVTSSRGTLWNMATLSAKVFKDVIYQDNFGVPYFYQRFGKGFIPGPCKALEGEVVLDAFGAAQNLILVLTRNNKGIVNKTWLKMANGHWTKVATLPTDEAFLNITKTDKFWVEIEEDGVLSYGAINDINRNVLRGCPVTMDMILFKGPKGVYCHEGKNIYQINITA